MSAARQVHPDELIVLGDLGSTFTKVACVTRQGLLLSRSVSKTMRQSLARGFTRAREQVLRNVLPPGLPATEVTAIACSSAAGGLRLCVVGKEATLTVQAGRQAASTAGARITSCYATAELLTETAAGFAAAAPDIVLLTGGANQGDKNSIIASAGAICRLAPDLPIIVAGNEEAYPQLQRMLSGRGMVQFVPNVMPQVGTLDAGPAQEAIRSMFAEHVMGRGRYLSASVLSGVVRMPTPSAVLAGACALSDLGDRYPPLRNPVVVDVGGATTDVHAVLDGAATRTVEGDLGLRENADALLGAGCGLGLVSAGDDSLDHAVAHRREHRDYIAGDSAETEIDRRLAGLACTIALERHAGRFRVLTEPDGGVVTKTGHDLRRATSIIATGGIFQHAAHPERIVSAALQTARARRALVSASLTVSADRNYVLWAVGLLASESPAAARRLAEREFTGMKPRCRRD